ncbi:Archaeal ATPase family [Aciduliprofundum boonei T469]|nr:Archaeal ATPase family [Aciduliprofundum boonei T469]
MNMGSRIVVNRSEAEEIKSIGGWVLIFGRRKVGKTFLIKNFLNYDIYFFIRRDGRIRMENGNEEIDTEGMIEKVKIYLMNGKTVVIDEFQRLPEEVWDDIASVHPSGRLILSGSSMSVVSKLLSKNSPFLGIIYPYRLGLIRAKDILNSLFSYLSPEKAIEVAPYLRDPWTIPLFTSPEKFFPSLLNILPYAIPALIGEIFTEEERELTKTYYSIISLIGEGYLDYREIASILYTRKIIKSPASSSVLPYIKNLRDMGILREIKRYGKKRYVYEIDSEPAKMFYYLDSRYDLSREITYDEVKPTLDKLHNLAIERFVADLFAELYGGRVEYLKEANREIDILITKRNKPIIVGEVKWGKATKKDIENFEKKTENFYCRKIFFTRRKIKSMGEIEVLTPEDLLQVLQ